MSVVTVGKNGRVYQRKFDHDDACARHEAGEALAALAREYGVSYVAVKRVCDPAFRAIFDARRTRRAYSGVCEMCGRKGITSASHRRSQGTGDGRVLCTGCRTTVRRTRFRFDDDGTLVAVRCHTIDCANGERWQPPENFPGGVRYRDVRANGIHNMCRACNTRMRRNHRQRQAAAA